MQIYICIYRYICMELYQQSECCSLRLYWTPLGSSQRTWQQFHLVTSRPGQTGLAFVCFQRPRGASVRTCLEPDITSNQLERAEASRGERLGAHRPASRFPSCSAAASSSPPPPSAPPAVPGSRRPCLYVGATFLCNQTTFRATEQLLNARQVRTMAEH